MTIPAETEMTNTAETMEPRPVAREAELEQSQSRTEGVDLEGAVQEENNNDVDDDDDDVTIIMLDHNVANDSRNRPEDAFAWIESNAPEMEERRRNVLVRELRRVQRASFIHFVLLCLIPTALLIIVIATVVGDEENCESDATFCSLEPRSFLNAFTVSWCSCAGMTRDAATIGRAESNKERKILFSCQTRASTNL